MPARPPRSVLLLFVDGVGVGRRDPATNPFARLERTLLGRFIDEIPGGRHAESQSTERYNGDQTRGPHDGIQTRGEHDSNEVRVSQPGELAFGGFWKPVDATLGVAGLPQSATGQATILTGRNVPKIVGGHVSAVPDRRVRAVLESANLFSLLVRAGKRPTFANAYTPAFFARARPHISATTRSMIAAGLELRRIEDLTAGRAVFHDYTNSLLISPRKWNALRAGSNAPGPGATSARPKSMATRAGAFASPTTTTSVLSGAPQRSTDSVSKSDSAEPRSVPGPTTSRRPFMRAGSAPSPRRRRSLPVPTDPIPERSAEEAARILLDLAREHDFVMHEHFLTDLAGHRGTDADRDEAALRIETLVEAIASRAADEEVLFIVVSDHGNLEDGTTRLHTMNAVPFLAWGPGARDAVASATDLTHVTPAVLGALNVRESR